MHSSLGVLTSGKEPTMSSLEMVDYINADRKAEGLKFPCKRFTRIQHKHILAKTPKVLGETSAKFLADDTYLVGNGARATRQIYNFPKREACLMAMSYSYELQAQVFDHMTELEVGSGVGFTIQQLQHMLEVARKASDEDSSDAGRRLRKRKDDLVVMKKAERLIGDISQMAFSLIGGGKTLNHE
ncbi:Rha family transcriptional regulator [Raoultella ornithinolytica]|uniref:Rha family transcriptional regulator n=1 Tax=Raoultella ornithinolytica TaxID=54291 RepID=UPI001C7DB678|nr:Rha family transcriptional regulator [Raoultella ornithinolytica]